MTAPSENNNYTYRNQVNAAIGQLRLALETNDMGGACASTQWRVAEHGQCDRSARPVQRGRHAAAPTVKSRVRTIMLNRRVYRVAMQAKGGR